MKSWLVRPAAYKGYARLPTWRSDGYIRHGWYTMLIPSLIRIRPEVWHNFYKNAAEAALHGPVEVFAADHSRIEEAREIREENKDSFPDMMGSPWG